MKASLMLLVCMTFLISCKTFPTYFVSNTESFTVMQSEYQSVYLAAYPPSVEQSLEWQEYKKLFKTGFQKNGIYVTSDIEKSDIVAFISYGISDGVTKTTPIIGQTGGGEKNYSGNVYADDGSWGSYSGTVYEMPTYGVVDYQSTEVFTRHMNMDIVKTESLQEEKVIKVYEGRLRSSGSCNRLSSVMPILVEHFFVNFPNNSQKYRTDSEGFEC